MNKDAGKKVGEIKDKTEEIKDEAEKKEPKNYPLKLNSVNLELL